MNLSEKKLTLGDLDFGQPDAEADKRLGDYFIKTPQAELAVNFRRTHFIGRKGAGKSALFSQLPALLTQNGNLKTRVVLLTPDQYAWSALRSYKEQGLQAEQAHANAWKFTIALEAAAALRQEPEANLSETALAHAKTLRKFVDSNFGKQKVIFNESALRLLKGVKSFNLEAFGLGIGLDRDISEQQISPQIVELILRSVENVSGEVGVVVAFDRLDDSWDGTDDAKSLMVGLLKAVKEINDRFSNKNGFGLSAMVFLRADIYDGLRFDDKDKHRAAEELITWNDKLLRDMINARLPEGVTIDELFEPGEMRGSISPFSYIVKRTFLRPREVIQFMQECVRRAGSDAVEISKDAVRDAEERYSVWKVEDVTQEFRRVFPDIDGVVESLRQGYNRYDSIEEFEAHLRERAQDIIAKHTSRTVVQMLFDASIIGVRISSSGSPRFKCEDSDAMLPSKAAVYVHQGLYKGLSIRERRRESGEPEEQ